MELKQLTRDEILTEIAAVQNLQCKFQKDRNTSLELDEQLENLLELLDEATSREKDD